MRTEFRMRAWEFDLALMKIQTRPTLIARSRTIGCAATDCRQTPKQMDQAIAMQRLERGWRGVWDSNWAESFQPVDIVEVEIGAGDQKSAGWVLGTIFGTGW